MTEPCHFCAPSGAHVDPVCEKHPTFDVRFGQHTRQVSREEWNGSVPLANAVHASLMEAYEAHDGERS